MLPTEESYEKREVSWERGFAPYEYVLALLLCVYSSFSLTRQEAKAKVVPLCVPVCACVRNPVHLPFLHQFKQSHIWTKAKESVFLKVEVSFVEGKNYRLKGGGELCAVSYFLLHCMVNGGKCKRAHPKPVVFPTPPCGQPMRQRFPLPFTLSSLFLLFLKAN